MFFTLGPTGLQSTKRTGFFSCLKRKFYYLKFFFAFSQIPKSRIIWISFYDIDTGTSFIQLDFIFIMYIIYHLSCFYHILIMTANDLILES